MTLINKEGIYIIMSLEYEGYDTDDGGYVVFDPQIPTAWIESTVSYVLREKH